MVIDWCTVFYVGLIGLMALIVVGLLIFLDHRLERKRMQEHEYFLSHEMVSEARKAVFWVLGKSMDIMPEKLQEIKRQIEGGE